VSKRIAAHRGASRPHRTLATCLRIVAALWIAVHGAGARAELWADVDEQGRSHVANHQVDSRYRLFFKGQTTLDAPNGPGAERAEAIEALAGTRLYERAMDPAVTERFESLIRTHARANGLDPALVKAVVAVESAFDPRAVSDKGAVGLMQVLPQTGERYGLAGDAHRSSAQKLLDPATNVKIGTRYLRDLLARFANNRSLALAAYNAGEGAVATRDNVVPPFAETRDYVRLVERLYAIDRPEEPAPPTRVRILGQPSRSADAALANRAAMTPPGDSR
jgi:soluble lytic murein transglycosylase-like protein